MRIQFLKNLIERHNKNTTPNLVSGFTIVEAIIAVFILSLSITAMLGLTASSITSAKYAHYEITANYLLQEAIDSIRNSRDTLVFQMKNDAGGGWDGFVTRYSACFSVDGCALSTQKFSPDDTTPTDAFHYYDEVVACNLEGNSTFDGLKCPVLKYDSVSNVGNGAYYKLSTGSASRYNRQVKMELIGTGQIKVTAKVYYLYGNTLKNRTLEMTLYNWKS